MDNLIKKVLDTDLKRIGLSQRELVSKLNAAHPLTPVSETAVSNWKKENRIPARRLADLLQLLGENGALATALAAGDINKHGEAVSLDEPVEADMPSTPVAKLLHTRAARGKYEGPEPEFEQRLVELSNGAWHSYFTGLYRRDDRPYFVAPQLAIDFIWKGTDKIPTKEQLGYAAFYRGMRLMRLRERSLPESTSRIYAILLIDPIQTNAARLAEDFRPIQFQLELSGIYSRIVRTPEDVFEVMSILMEGRLPPEDDLDEIPF
ncbi:MAG: hypothetical protein CGW95_06565 [Phenylobacterium zucineum]|nr:MAG: hypothetical protein CGW95_06565 [Phenylobacterium zucineum]